MLSEQEYEMGTTDKILELTEEDHDPAENEENDVEKEEES